MPYFKSVVTFKNSRQEFSQIVQVYLMLTENILEIKLTLFLTFQI